MGARDFWLEPWERQAILDFQGQFPLEGYRRLTFMMLDANVVAVSPASVWRALHHAGRLSRWNTHPSQKGRGIDAPGAPHEHWHVDGSYLNLGCAFYYLSSVLEGFSRSIVHSDIRTSMTEADIELILERAKEKFPQARPRIISDNGLQFIARDFKEFIRLSGMTHFPTSPFYPQSNAFVPAAPFRSKTLAAWSRATSSTTTSFGCTASWATSPQAHAGRPAAGYLGPALSRARCRSFETSTSSSLFLPAAFSNS